MSGAEVRVVGARQHNLRDLDLTLPKQRLTVVTGVSGSGKSSLVFDVLAAESQRQLDETFPAFVRTRLPHRGRPEVDRITGLGVAIVVDQERLGGSARSTVGTATEVWTLLRLLFSRVGRPHAGESTAFSFNDPRGKCPRCEGLGTTIDVAVGELLDDSRSLDGGALTFPTFEPGGWRWKRYALSGMFDPDLPVREWTPEQRELLLHAEPRKLPDPPEGYPRSGGSAATRSPPSPSGRSASCPGCCAGSTRRRRPRCWRRSPSGWTRWCPWAWATCGWTAPRRRCPAASRSG